MNPTCIISGDLHLRDDIPICRTDNFWEAQANKIHWLNDLQEKYECPILDAGDMFNTWKPSYYLVQWAIKNLPNGMITIPGNHDLPQHNLELFTKCGLGVLAAAKVLKVLRGEDVEIPDLRISSFPWNYKLDNQRYGDIALCHVMTYQGRNPWPGCTAMGALELLKFMKGFDLVITGHNHKSFVVEHHGRLLVNPGSLTRQTVDQVSHKPCVYLWYANDNHVEPVYAPIQENVINREHIEKIEDRETRIDAFVDRLSGDFSINLSFEDNLEKFFSANRVRSKTKEMVMEAIGS